MRDRLQKVIQDTVWLCYLSGAHIIMFLPIVMLGMVGVATPLAWIGVLDWPLWIKLIMVPISGISLYVANDLLNELPRQVDNVYRRWNGEPIRPPVRRDGRHSYRQQQAPRRHVQPSHVRVRPRQPTEE